ncbi:hypothetical protein ANCCAN_03941 [Ancylostoma caninum]|uniref:Uncharacterized protein n=1 Tax=Ancylostoma caninum TaxID=29170 RepID=A0A368GZY3_ANCCA|nr:hypothetical protein ANCCAN_03941 [Ancylostoma caninum]
MPLCIANLRSSYFNNGITLPSYEEALSMGNTPNSDVIPNNLQRIAPDRPGSRRTLTLPPSYDSAMSTEHAPESPETRPRTSNPTQPYTLS